MSIDKALVLVVGVLIALGGFAVQIAARNTPEAQRLSRTAQQPGDVSVDAQTQAPTELDLLRRMARQPSDISAYLDLATLYGEQHRYEEAVRMLQNAVVILQRQQATSLPKVQS